MENFNSLTNIIESNESLSAIVEMINSVVELPETDINDDNIDVIIGMIEGGFTENMRKEAITNLTKGFKEQNLSKQECNNNVETFNKIFMEYIASLKLSSNKQRIVNAVFDIINDLFDAAIDQLTAPVITLPVKLDEGAQVPTYAHSTDAAADLYAADTVTLPAHSISNMIRTGVHIALPEGWMAMIFPRSSIGAKTGLRLSNSAGIIDSEYRGPLGVLYDNISDSDYTINAGDRIAQLLIMPSYHFSAQVVDILPATERNDGGFGSSGK